MRTFITALVLTLVSSYASAHALWIETKPNGIAGKSHEAQVFLGEYAANERDSIHNWFSNMKDFKLLLVAPDGSRTELKTEAKGNYFSAQFTPVTEGVYFLTIDQPVAQIYGTSKIYYHAQATVKVGKSMKGAENVSGINDAVMLGDVNKVYTKNQSLETAVSFKSKPAADTKINVQSVEGWSKEFKADLKGVVVFEPAWKGRYLLEGSFTEESAGKQNDQEYQSVWHCVTNCIEVN